MSTINGNGRLSGYQPPIYLSAVPAPPLAAFLGRTHGNYRPSAGIYGQRAFHYGVQEGEFSWYDIPRMRKDPQVKICMRVIRGPLNSVKWKIKAKNAQVAADVDATIKRFWQNDLDKAIKMVEWGAAAAAVNWTYDRDTGHVRYEDLQEFSVLDAKPLQIKGQLVGISVSGLGMNLGQTGVQPSSTNADPNKLFAPRYVWFANEPEFGAFYGKSRYEAAWAPWMEKRGKKGAIDTRRLGYFKNAFRGGNMQHPIGAIETDSGVVSNADYAREIVEKIETGGVTTTPAIFDEHGNPLWKYDPAQQTIDPEKFLSYPKELDIEITKGMEIPPEVVEQVDGAGGWNNRSVPFIVFLTGEDCIAKSILTAFVKHVCRPMIAYNYGEDEQFEVEAESLLPKDDPNAQPGQPGQPQPGQPKQPGQDGGDAGLAGLAAKQNSPQQAMQGGGLALSYDDAIKAAAAEVDTDPTDEQKAAGNYRKGHVTIQGLPITIENPKGSVRRGKSKDGKEWSQEMAHHYGYIKRTESEADGDHVDVFIGPNPESEIVFVVDQVGADGERFDEHKSMLGFTSAKEAKDAYHANYSAGWKGFAGIKALTMPTFKEWLKTGATGRPICEQEPASLSSEPIRVADLDWVEIPDLPFART